MSAQHTLAVRMDPKKNDAGASSVREYLVKLLELVWVEEADFNGKRPFGNSGWEYEIYEVLIRAGLIEGSFDEDGYIDSVDVAAADRLVVAAIQELGR